MSQIIALDLGSTAIKGALLDANGQLQHLTSQSAPMITVNGPCVESDALAYATVAEQVLDASLAHADAAPVLGLCSQRSSFLLWRTSDGAPVTPLISWQDTRGAAICSALQAQEPYIQQHTGLRLTPYYFAPKLQALLQEQPALRAGLECGELLVGTLDSYLLWRWSAGQHHVTDASMAARTLLYDLHSQQWSAALCRLFDLDPAWLPAVMPSNRQGLTLQQGITLQASLADQSAALLSTLAPGSNELLVNLGTGGFVLRYLAGHPPPGYLHTLVYQPAAEKTLLALEGTLNSIAAALKPWPVHDCILAELGESEIFCVAEPSGLGAPYFRDDIGMTFSAAMDEITPRQRAVLLLEGIIFRVCRIVEELQQDRRGRVYLSGGLSELSCLQQGLASCLAQPLHLLLQHDASLLGAGLLAAGKPVSSSPPARVIAATEHLHLRKKYERWKVWLDGLLAR